jgi:hypothetical protein
VNEKTPAITLMIVAFALPILAIIRRNILMYFSASALAGFEIIMLLTTQLFTDNMDHISRELSHALAFIFISCFTVHVFGIKFAIFLLSSLIFIEILFGTIRNKL